jgi:hypothetical protein
MKIETFNLNLVTKNLIQLIDKENPQGRKIALE